MKRYSIRRRQRIVFGVIAALILLISMNPAFQPVTNEFDSLQQAFEEKRITQDDIFNIIETDSYAYVQIADGLDYQTQLYQRKKDGNLITYVFESESLSENYFHDMNRVIDIELEKSLFQAIQNTPNFFKQENLIYSFTTSDQSQLGLKVNGKKADAISTYKRDGQLVFFLLFKQINFQQEPVILLE